MGKLEVERKKNRREREREREGELVGKREAKKKQGLLFTTDFIDTSFFLPLFPV